MLGEKSLVRILFFNYSLDYSCAISMPSGVLSSTPQPPEHDQEKTSLSSECNNLLIFAEKRLWMPIDYFLLSPGNLFYCFHF